MATPTTPTTTTVPAAIRREAPQRAIPEVPPPVDIYETDNSYVLLADMPGVKPDDIHVVAERNQLVIRGRVEPPQITYDYQEWEPTNYFRAFALTDDLDPNNITVTFRDGVLRCEIQKSERVKPKRIPIRTE